MKCSLCYCLLSFEQPDENCFVGYSNDKQGKPDTPVTLCSICYYRSICGFTNIIPRLYSYPMKYRPTAMPPRSKMPLNGLGLPGERSDEEYIKHCKACIEVLVRETQLPYDFVWRRLGTQFVPESINI